MSDEQTSQVIKAFKSVLKNVIQVVGDLNIYQKITINVTNEADTQQLKQQLTTIKEHHWQEQYEHLRIDVNGGYSEIVSELLNQLITEIKAYETNEESVNAELKANIYRLAATVYLPHQSGGDAQKCADFITQAQSFRSEDNLARCQILQALLDYESGDNETALEILSNLTTNEALRLRFAIYLETKRLDECHRLIENGIVDPNWGWTKSDWIRAFLGYYTAIGSQTDAENALNLLIDQAPTASNYQVAAHALVNFAYTKMQAFCLAHDVFPNFHVALELDDLVDSAAQSRAASLFAKTAALYHQKGCTRAAVQMLRAAILLSLDDDPKSANNLARWVAKLSQLDPHHPLLIMLKAPEYNLIETVGEPPTLLDLQPLLANPTTEPLYILLVALTVSDTSARAAEVALILERYLERFKISELDFAHYAFVVLQLWQIAKNQEQALIWLKHSKTHFSHPHLAPLYYAWFYWHQDDFQMTKSWVEQALSVAPSQPEVLAVACLVYHQLGELEQQLTYVRMLFEILQTGQTATWYLSALWRNRDYRSILSVLESAKNLTLEEQDVRTWRAQALIGSNRGLEARADLEWLRVNNVASPADLLNLAGAYHLLNDLDAAIHVLQDCIQRFPKEAEAYLQLSYTYLITSRRDESFRWALKAHQEFPDAPEVLFHLWSISFPTGQELHSEVRAAFGAFLPGGRFADQSPFISFTLEEFTDLIRSQQAAVTTPEDLYHASHISYMILCGLRNIPLFLAHREAIQNGAVRYIANSEQLQDLTQILEDRPRQVVLDYSALLTLWSLLGSAMLPLLTQYFDCIWLPSQLRTILLYEQDRLANLRQVALYQAKCVVRDTLNLQADKFVIHSRVDPPGGWDVLGRHTEITVAQRENLIHFDEHIPPGEPISSVPTIGISLLADILHEAGEIDLLTVQALKEYAKSPTPQEITLKKDLERTRAIVVSISTLVTWAMRSNLEPILNYFERLHLAEPARDRLLWEISGYEFYEQSLTSLQSMRRVLRQGEEDGLITFDTIPEEEHVIRQHLEEQRNASQTDTPEAPDPIRDRLFDYLDELLGLAHRENIPIWIDDRWTKGIRLEQRQPRYSFGTDTFLAFAHQHIETAKSLSIEQYHAYYDKLVQWGYRFLPINAEHIIWHLHHGKDMQNKVLTSLLQHYCQSITKYLDWMHQTASREAEQIANQLVGSYNRQLVATLHKLYEQGIDLKTSANIFAALDLSRQAAGRVLGREPLVLSLFLLDAVLSQPMDEASASTAPAASQQDPSYSQWLNRVILESGVRMELLEETWFQLAQYFFNLIDNAETDINRFGALVLMERMLDAMPVQAMQYLLSTDIGSRLQQDFKLQIHERISYRFVQKTGDEIELHLLTPERQRNYDEALNRYLEDPSATTISTDLITLKIHQVAPGSIFLVIEEIPTEIHRQYPDARGVTGYVCVLYGFASSTVSHRELVWQIGSQALQRHQLSTSTWNALQERVLTTDEPGIQLGLQLRRHLLGQAAITKAYFAQAAQLAPASIIQLLSFIEPSIIRAWLALPSLDWSSADALIQWTGKVLSPQGDEYHQFDVIGLLEYYGRSIFPDTPVIRQHILSVLDGLSSPSEQCDLIEALLSFTETQSSLALKANVVLIGFEWLYRRDGNAPQNRDANQDIPHRLNSLLVQILQGWQNDNSRQAAIATLEVIICRWLYYNWSIADLGEYKNLNELAYLGHIGASHIIDALATDGQISLEMTQSIISELNSNIKTGSIVWGIEPQPNGFFRPIWCLSVNYAASYLLKGLLSNDQPLHEFHLDANIKAAALSCGFEHRREQVFCSPILPEPSWLDSELAIDIGLVSVAILGSPGEAEIESWSEQERHLLIFASASEAIRGLPKTIIATLPDMDDKHQFMQHILSLFQGQVQPSPKWYEFLQDFFSEEVLNKLRQFAECYGEVMWRLGQMVMHPGENCPAELTTSINTLLFEVPTDKNASALIEIKADVLSQLIGLGLSVEPVCQWFRQVAEEKTDDVPMIRLALRPFILRWPYYSEAVGEPLYEVLIEIAHLPSFRNLWEFARLVRYKHAPEMNETSASKE